MNKKNKLFVLISALTVLISACGPKEPQGVLSPSASPSSSSSTSSSSVSATSPSSTPIPQELNYLKLRELFLQKSKETFSSIPYKGYVKIIKDGNSMKFIYLNEAVTGNFVDVKLHYQTIWMDIDNKDNIVSQQKPLSNSDSEFVDLNNNKINSIFSCKCNDQYNQEALKDIDKYSAYDYFRFIKEGYNIEITYGGKEYDRSKELVDDKYYKTSYRLNLDKCERLNLSVVEKIARPSYYPVSTDSTIK